MMTWNLKEKTDFFKLSYYTLCKISERMQRAHIDGMLLAIHEGRYEGVLVTDNRGNYISFR